MFYTIRYRVETILWDRFGVDISYANLSARRYDRRAAKRAKRTTTTRPLLIDGTSHATTSRYAERTRCGILIAGRSAGHVPALAVCERCGQ